MRAARQPRASAARPRTSTHISRYPLPMVPPPSVLPVIAHACASIAMHGSFRGGGASVPLSMGLFLFRRPGTHTLALPHTLTVTLRTLCVRVLRTLVSWCERVSLPGVLVIVIRRSRHGRVVTP